MTSRPLILSASIDETDREVFDALRRRHFPPQRNFLRAHLTLFHHLPGSELELVSRGVAQAAAKLPVLSATVNGLRHLGSGVAFTIECAALLALHAELSHAFGPWLGAQDRQGWRPHITVQNKVPKADADALFAHLKATFEPWVVTINGVDLWHYMDGPWQHEAHAGFIAASI